MAIVVIVVILMLAIVGFVIRRTLMTKEREGRVEVMVMKIGISHLQTVALASTFDLQWPQSAMRLYDTLDTASSVSPNVVSLDCLVDRQSSTIGNRTFYLKTAVVLLAPIMFIAAIALFWIGRYFLCGWISNKARDELIRDTAGGLSEDGEDNPAGESAAGWSGFSLSNRSMESRDEDVSQQSFSMKNKAFNPLRKAANRDRRPTIGPTTQLKRKDSFARSQIVRDIILA